MRVEYSERAVLDLYRISDSSKREYGEDVALQLAAHIEKVVQHISEDPHSRPSVVHRPGVHVAALVRFPFKLFYRIQHDRSYFAHQAHIPAAMGVDGLLTVGEPKRNHGAAHFPRLLAEEEPDWRLQDHGKVVQSATTDVVDAVLVNFHLLDRHSHFCGDISERQPQL
jgi:toxin ParE1/3/4